jgi:hypothetical protein
MAYELRAKVGRQAEVVVVSDSARFHFVPSNPWVALRWRKPEDIKVHLPVSLPRTTSGICGAAPLASAFSDDSSQGTVQSYVRPVLRGLGPLASMRSAMRVAHQYFAL